MTFGFRSKLMDFKISLPETNIAPKNGWLEYYFPIGEAYFQGQTVSFREGNDERSFSLTYHWQGGFEDFWGNFHPEKYLGR